MIPPQTVERFKTLFNGRETYHGQYRDGPEKRVQTIKSAAPAEAWVKHLEGDGPYLGQVPIRLDNTCHFGAIDLDDDTINHGEIAQHVQELGIPLVVCRSKSGGAHLYLFMEKSVPAPIVVKVLKTWSKMLGFETNADGRAIEIFPKQTAIRAKDSGNWINLPYYGGDSSTRKAVNAVGDLLPLEQFLSVAEMLRVKDADALLAIQPHSADIFADGPPCLQTLHAKGLSEGTRNSGLYNIAIFFKLAFPQEWKDKVAQYNEENLLPPLTKQEVTTVISSVERKDYSYNCDELPIQPHCQKALCNKRKYGVMRLKAKLAVMSFPSLTKLRKILTDPPRWLVMMDGQELELTTDDLIQLPRLRRVAFEKINLVLPPIKANDYDDILRSLLAEAEAVDAPEDAGHRGQFFALVDQFLARRKTAEAREDLLQGLPFEEHSRVYFRSGDLLSFLERKKFNRYSPAEIYTALRSMGATHQPLRTKKTVLKVWSMPLPDNEQLEEFDPLAPEKTGSGF